METVERIKLETLKMKPCVETKKGKRQVTLS